MKLMESMKRLSMASMCFMARFETLD